jgi:hypothetical protein
MAGRFLSIMLGIEKVQTARMVSCDGRSREPNGCHLSTHSGRLFDAESRSRSRWPGRRREFLARATARRRAEKAEDVHTVWNGSSGEQPCQVATGALPLALEVVLLNSRFVLPWSQVLLHKVTRTRSGSCSRRMMSGFAAYACLIC